MPGKEVCQACQEPHEDARPPGLRFGPLPQGGLSFTGPDEVLRQDHVRDQVLDSYERDLEIMSGSCLYCQVMGRRFLHMPGACSRRCSRLAQ